MSATQQSKDPVLVVLQLTGGNDYLNTVIPYNNGLYKDNRKAVGIPDSDMIHLDQAHAMPNYMAPLKKFCERGRMLSTTSPDLGMYIYGRGYPARRERYEALSTDRGHPGSRKPYRRAM
jgi:uncharacterized protein (DUF1501 family)